MSVTTRKSLAGQMHLPRHSLILRPGRQEGGRYLLVSARYVFWLLVIVAAYTVPASADTDIPTAGDECDVSWDRSYTYQCSRLDGQGILVTCTCKVEGNVGGPGVGYWVCPRQSSCSWF